jgi:hypothetical protein
VHFLSETAPGSVHDKTLAERTEFRFPSDSELHQDSAFQAFAPVGVVIYQPIKKKPGKERSAQEREHNRVVSQIRVAIEHILAGVKRVRIVKERFRNTKANFADRVMLIACGLHNLRQSVRHPLLPPLRPEHAISNNVYSIMPWSG